MQDGYSIIGIGCSAGGQEALRSFLEHLPVDFKHPLVIVTHLSPNHPSFLESILSKHTHLPVVTIEDGLSIRPATIFLIPHDKNVTLEHTEFKLTERPPSPQINLPINIFFNSLSKHFQKKGIAIVLTGMGKDGSAGIRSVKEQGGYVLAQDLGSASFSSMPEHAIRTGLVDVVCHPWEMPDKLVAYLANTEDQFKSIEDHHGEELGQLLGILNQSTSIDFSIFKQGQLIQLLQQELYSLPPEKRQSFAHQLWSDQIMQSRLLHHLLTNQTGFFEDNLFWDAVRERVIPEILASHKLSSLPLRFWIIGCHTGEEAYSLAILLFEALGLEDGLTSVGIEIIATDINDKALIEAAQGVYQESRLSRLSAKQIKQFFSKTGNGMRITPQIRRMVTFAKHHVAQDFPLGGTDCILFRNQIRKLTPDYQTLVLERLHYGLNRNGYLLLGNGDSLGEISESFEAVDQVANIFKNKAFKAYNDGEQVIKLQADIPNQSISPHKTSHELIYSINRVLLSTKKIACFLIDNNFTLLHATGLFDPFLKKEGFSFSLSLFDILPESIENRLELAAREVINTQEQYTFSSLPIVLPNGETMNIDLIVSPYPSGASETPRLLVFLIPSD